MVPVIGITVDNRENTADSGVYESAAAYSRAVTEAGGLPVLLPHEVPCIDAFADYCDGLVLTGGVDPDTRAFGQRLHVRARVMDPIRQRFETGLIAAAAERDLPLLGVCLGMQLMALHAGGTLNQYMPDTMPDDVVSCHMGDHRHVLRVHVTNQAFGMKAGVGHETVVSSHRQCVADAGELRVIATAVDDVIEAIDNPQRRFCLGVQWHPERGGDGPFSRGLFHRLIDAARGTVSTK